MTTLLTSVAAGRALVASAFHISPFGIAAYHASLNTCDVAAIYRLALALLHTKNLRLVGCAATLYHLPALYVDVACL